VVTVTALKEVILSAGSVGTPQILQLSGIGNANDLKKLKIESIINNPNVGENLSDHTFLPNIFSVQDNGQSFDHIMRDNSLVQGVLDQWIQNKTGLFADNIANNFGFARLPSNATIFKTVRDPAAGPKSPHWELIITVYIFKASIILTVLTFS
jgi:choline dehydrogenase-like flavoprotein